MEKLPQLAVMPAAQSPESFVGAREAIFLCDF